MRESIAIEYVRGVRIFRDKVNSAYGAPMGRHTGPETLWGKVYLQRIRLNSGGYDTGGAYWGIGAPLYLAQDHDGNSMYFRARNRQSAKDHLIGIFETDIRFFR